MQRQKGFSIVELLIGMAVGLLLVAGIIQIFVGNKSSFEAQEEQTALQENVRVSFFLLGLTLGHTGFRPNAFNDESDSLSDDALAGTNGGNDKFGRDTISVRYVSDDNMHDCFGTALADGEESLNRFHLGPAQADGLRDLRCERSVIQPDGTVSANSTNAIIDNVESMHILYGVDTDNDRSVDRYVDAPGVGDFDAVLSLKVGLVMVTEGQLRPAGGPQTVTLFGTEQQYGSNTDRRQREVIEQVIALRNRLL